MIFRCCYCCWWKCWLFFLWWRLQSIEKWAFEEFTQKIYLEMKHFYELLISLSTTDVIVMNGLRKCDFNGCNVLVWDLIDSWKLCLQTIVEMLFSIDLRREKKRNERRKKNTKRRDWKYSPFIPVLMFNEAVWLCRLWADSNNGSFFLIGQWIYSVRKLKQSNKWTKEKRKISILFFSYNTWRACLIRCLQNVCIRAIAIHLEKYTKN